MGSEKGWGQIATPLSVQTAGGPQKINCANTEGMFRFEIQKTSWKEQTLEISISLRILIISLQFYTGEFYPAMKLFVKR